MILALYLASAFVVGYLIGNINFARIFCRIFGHEDITKEGSKNPGTMNVLRTRGFGEAMLTLIFETIKSGAPALGGYYLFEHFFAGYGNLAFFVIGFGAVVGHCFPVFYKFKGGKGVACTFGMFLFHPVFWWIALIVFACGFISFLFISYPFLINIAAMLALTVFATVYFALDFSLSTDIAILSMLWLDFALIVFLHRGNFKRLFAGTENKINLLEKLKKKKKSEDVDEEKDETK
jgi:glycerol-3-phosphate acyltransferase PlsY